MARQPLEIPPDQATRPRPFTKQYTFDVPRRLRFDFDGRSTDAEGGAWIVSLLTRGTLGAGDDYILPTIPLRPSTDLFADFRTAGDERIPPGALICERSDGGTGHIAAAEIGTVLRLYYEPPVTTG